MFVVDPDPLTVREGQDGIAEAAVISIALTCQQAPTWGAEGVCPIDRPPLMDVMCFLYLLLGKYSITVCLTSFNHSFLCSSELTTIMLNIFR